MINVESVPRDSDLTGAPIPVSNVAIDMPDPDESLRTTYNRKPSALRTMPPPRISETIEEQDMIPRAEYEEERDELLKRNDELVEKLEVKELEIEELTAEIE